MNFRSSGDYDVSKLNDDNSAQQIEQVQISNYSDSIL